MKVSAVAVLVFIPLIVALSGPNVQLGSTTVTGLSFPEFGQDVFLGTYLIYANNIYLAYVVVSSIPHFTGIPFSEPPVGALRFSPPVLKSDLGSATFIATSFGPSCPLFGSAPENDEVSEDCLSINIFRPSGASPSSELPVLFYVYGSGFEGTLLQK